MKGELWIAGGTLLTLNASDEVVEDGFVHVRDGKIFALGSGMAPPPGVPVLDASGCLVTPGFVNMHTHSPMALLRGVADDLPLTEWLQKAIFPLEQKFVSAEFAYLGTLLASLEMIRTGTTTFNDMYFFEDQVARASHEAGLRAVCGQTLVEISDVDHLGDQLIDRLESFRESVAQYPRVLPAVAPHSVYGVKPATWEKLIKYAAVKNLRIHTHVSEVPSEVEQCQKAHGRTPVKFFEELGLWKHCKVIAAHMTCLTDEDIAIAGSRGVGIAHNIDSNLKLGARIAPLVELRRAGARVGIGTDGPASNNNLDLLQEVDTVAKLQSFRLGPGAFTARDAFRMLTLEGAEALGLDSMIGSLEVGKAADLVAVDVTGPHATPLYDPFSHLVYCAGGSDVKHSVVAGQVILKDFRVTSLDEAAILAEARRWEKRIAQFRPTV